MCARLLSCPLCSQPGFATLDALRAGLVSVATRPLACPVCNETLLGIDKLTIHLFGHTINANDNRSASNKLTDANCNNSIRQVTHNGATTLPHNWSSQRAQTISSNRSRPGEISCDNDFSPLSNLNSAQSVTTMVTSKDVNSQGCARASETMGKSQNQIVYVQNSSQQQFCSPRSIKAESSLMSNASDAEAYGRNTVPMVFMDENERIPSVSSKNCHEHSAQTSAVVDAAMYRREAMEQNLTKHNNDTTKKEESVAQFSEAWIENLLNENGAKCSGASASEGKNHSVSSEELSGLPNGEEKYYSKKIEYQASNSTQTVSSEMIAAQENPLDSTDSNVQRTEEITNRNQQTSPNSNEVLPRWKAFRLLAMKDKTERCNICGTHFPDRNFIVLHKQLAHRIAEKDVNGTPDEPLKNCPCHLCTKVFKTRGTLMVHMRVAHMGYNLGFLSKNKESEMSCCENGFNCPTCGKNFRKEQHVTQHLKTHEGKQWECDVCSKMFTTKYFLKKHKRLHSGEMPYKCTICDKTFTFQQSYHKHRLYHKDDKPHTCATCGRSFKELSTLHNHERIHTGEKPFVCETCGKCFRQRVSYLVHRRIHTGVMPYKCTACGKSFRYKVSQRTHKCQAQPEDCCPPVVESSATSLQQRASCSDPLTATENGILLQNRVSELAPNENNKFILIVNTHGQPILTREADVRKSSFLNENQSTDSQSRVDNHKANESDENHLWNNHVLSRENASKECCASSPSQAHNVNEKLRTEDTNDFFSLVMSPLENDLSSPSTEMEHLRLESPGNEEMRQNESPEVCETTSTNSLQRDLNNAIDGIFRENCSGNSPLETINEESLKQLLYGIDRKNLD